MHNNLPQPHEQGMPPAQGWSPGAPAHFEDPEEGGQIHVRRLLGAVVRHKWIVLAVALVGTIAGLLYVRTMPDEYRARATIWIEPRPGPSGPIRSNELLTATAWIELLRSYRVLSQVVAAEGLFLDVTDPTEAAIFRGLRLGEEVRPGEYRLELDRNGGNYRLLAAGGEVLESGAIGDPIGGSIGLHWNPTASELRGRTRVDFRVRSPGEAASQLGSELQAQLARDGNFLHLQLRGRSPERTASVLNTVVESFIAVAGELKRGHLVELTGILEEQLDYAQRNMEGAERELEGFRVSTITLPSERSAPMAAGLEMTRDPVFGSFFELRIEQEQIRRDRQAILGAIAGSGVSVEALEVIPSVRGSSQLLAALGELTGARAELRNLRHRYTDEHPAVVDVADRLRQLERETVPTMARSLAAQLAARDGAIQRQIADASREMAEIPPRAIEEARLRRQVAVTEDLYTTLQRRYEETRLASASAIPDVRVLDRASVPQNPVGDERSRVLLMAMFGSLALGILGALARDRLDHTIRYADQISDDMGLTVLGAVPELKDRSRRLDRNATAEALEAFRGIRMNLMYAYGAAGPVVVVVSSPGPGDGKSFVTSNLALSFADLGKRVLLVDGDVRRGTLHRVVSRKRSPGLTDFLAGEVERSELVQPTAFENVSFVGTGKLRVVGPELISSPRMRTLLADLRGEYDVILIDTAPLGAGIDPFVFGTLTGNMVLVLRTDITNKELAESKLDLVARLPIRVLGSVINGLKERDHSYYHRYYSYLPGYESVDEDERTPTLPRVEA
jgi:capsular exopolysaccharide synthesis family protein